MPAAPGVLSGDAECAVELGHAFEGDGLGSGEGGDRGWRGLVDGLSNRSGGEATGAEVVGEGLSFLGEADAEKSGEAWGVDLQLREARGELETEDGGVDVGWRGKGGWGEGEEVLDLGVHPGGGGEHAVVADAGEGGDAIGDLALHHEDGAFERGGEGGGEEFEQDVGGDVVGEVADDVEAVRLGLGAFAFEFEQCGEVGFEDVGLVDADVGMIAEAEGEFGGEGGVELDSDETVGAGGEDLGEGAVAGADLDDGAGGEVAEGVDYGVAGAVVDEKVLAEFGFGVVGHAGC